VNDGGHLATGPGVTAARGLVEFSRNIPEDDSRGVFCYADSRVRSTEFSIQCRTQPAKRIQKESPPGHLKKAIDARSSLRVTPATRRRPENPG